jgi:hypothetical protein
LALISLVAFGAPSSAQEKSKDLAADQLLDQGWSAFQRAKYGDAMRWFRRAAHQGSARAEDQIGNMYELARGVPEDMRQAMVWYRKAADQGYAPAEVDIGILYANGWGVPMDEKRALGWYRKAAEQGYAQADEFVGIAYANGLGVAPNFAEARSWLDKAVAGGDPEAELYLCPPYHLAWYKALANKDVVQMDHVIADIDPNCADLLHGAKTERAKFGRPPPAQ